MDALAEGLAVQEVADDWDVSQTVVYRNIDRAKRKLRAHTKFHAVAIWVAMRQSQASSHTANEEKVA